MTTLQVHDLQRLVLGLPKSQINGIIEALNLESNEAQRKAWQRISQEILRPDHSFQLHQLLFKAVYQKWDAKLQGPPPLWMPSIDAIRSSNVAAFMASFGDCPEWLQRSVGDPQTDYSLLQRISCQQPELFWPQLLDHFKIIYAEQPERIYEEGKIPGQGQWLPGARLNIAHCALMCGDPDAAALIWAEESTPSELHSMSLQELRQNCMQTAAALNAWGAKPGDRIAVCMPMTNLSVIIYLGVILAGCAVVGIADSFSPQEIASRLRLSKASLVFTQDVIARDGKILPLYERATQGSKLPTVVLAASTKQPQVELRAGDISWHEFAKSGPETDEFAPHVAAIDDTTNILFSSGTTGEPKLIPWTHLTPIRAATDSWAQMDVRSGDVVAWPTNLGWMMGPFLIYAALFNGAAMALFHGAPLGQAFTKFVQAAEVTMLGVVPSIVRSWRRSSALKGIDWSCIRCFASTGEASSAEDSHWLSAQAGYKPVLEICGGTELGGGFLAGSMLQPQAPATFSTPTIGSQLTILIEDEDRQSSHDSGEACMGELTIVPPFLGGSQTLLNADHYKVYYKDMPLAEGTRVQLRRHGDIFERLPGGYYKAHGRSDDTMNLGGIKVSAVELERACMSAMPGVLEAAAVAAPMSGGGPDQLIMFVVPSGSSTLEADSTRQKCQRAIREGINPLFKLDKVIITQTLPRTASNKVMRRVLRAQFLAKPKL